MLVRLNGGSAEKGSLTSPAFTITEPVINFLIAGGNHPDTTCIKLLVDDKVVRTTTGTNSDLLKWDGWDVSDLIGKKAMIQIVDHYTGYRQGVHSNRPSFIFQGAAAKKFATWFVVGPWNGFLRHAILPFSGKSTT